MTSFAHDQEDVEVATTQKYAFEERRFDGPVPLRGLVWRSQTRGNTEVGERALPAPRNLVFLHGLGDGADVWRPVVEAWLLSNPNPAGIAEIIAVDLPGHGGSEWFSEGNYSVDRLTDCMVHFLQRAGGRRPTIVGHSLGATIALRLAARVGPRLHSMVLVDPSFAEISVADHILAEHIDALAVGSGTMNDMISLVSARIPMAERRVLESTIPFLCSAGSYASDGVGFPLDPRVKVLLSARDDDRWKSLRAAVTKVSIIRGEKSAVLSQKEAEKAISAARLPGKLVSIPQCGHAIPLERPGDLARALEVSI